VRKNRNPRKAHRRLTPEDIAYLSIGDLRKRYRERTLSPVEVAEIAIARIRDWNPHINAFCMVDEKAVIAAARASERRWRKARAGALDGVPVTVKDTLPVKGYPTRRGSMVTSEAPAEENAPAVDRILEQGAVMLGITTTPELGVGPVTISPLTGVTRNPWNFAKGSGGSSGGGAAATAAGLGCAALGTDAGGSIRIPSSL
jgi:aspartyl-tRNA(Asn)/glutamyl-tRNA(Gln) amidotransferase subunit A